MTDSTRPPSDATGPAKAFARFLTEWCRTSGDLIGALVVSRTTPGGGATTERLLRDPRLDDLVAGWNIWEEWIGAEEPSEADARLADHLPPRLLRRIRFALWGWGSSDD